LHVRASNLAFLAVLAGGGETAAFVGLGAIKGLIGGIFQKRADAVMSAVLK
jgi:hypothetical protein